MAFVELRHILLDVLPSPALMVQGRELRIQNLLEMICDHLWAINAVIVDAEIRALKERDLEGWMGDMCAAIGDLGDLLDGILDSAQARVVATASNPLFRHAIVSKLKKMARTLNDLMILGGSTFNLRKEMMNGMDPRREEYLTILTDEVVERDDDRDNVIDFLQHQKYNSDGVPIFIAIHGDHGMGKTTLARMIYHHPWVRQHFHHCIWVDVSKHLFSLDFVSIARECVESMTGEPSGHQQHPYLQLQERLGGSRYFLVLEDLKLETYHLENELKHKWNQFKHILLHVGGPGSTVIITTEDDVADIVGSESTAINATRNSVKSYSSEGSSEDDYVENIVGPEEESVVKSYSSEGSSEDDYLQVMVGPEVVGQEKGAVFKSYELKGVSEDDWVKLFMRHASFIIQPDHHQLLDKETASSPTPSIHHIDLLPTFAKQLYHQTDTGHGEPKAAKILGSIFRYTEVSRRQQLVHTLHIDRIDHESAGLLILDHLPISYDRVYLHRLFFPKEGLYDDSFDMEDFMHIMIVEGLIPHECDKNIISDILRLPYRHRDWYNMERVRSKYYFTMRVGQDSQIPGQCRHLCMLFNSNDSNASTFPMGLSAGAHKKLKTLILRREEEEEEMVPKVQKCQIAKFLEAMFVHLLNLRTLNLRDSRIQVLPTTVGKLLHLRYLNLSHTDIETLPRSLCNLGNLQILNLSHCEELRKLPGRIHKLRKLQTLKVAYCKKLRMLPESVTAVANLQELDLEGCRWLDQLPEGFGNMKRLRELNMQKCVSLTRMPRGIGQLISLRKLSGFAIDGDLGSITQQELQPLVNLEELRLRVSSSQDIHNIKLQEKLKLKNLALHWEWWNMDDDDDDDADKAILINLQQQVLEDFRPNSVLEELEIISYLGQKLPSWMTARELYVISLVEIRLINLKRCERLPPLGQLPHLEIVEISGMDSINVVDEAFYGDSDVIFLSLEKLIFSQMPALEKWTMRERKDDVLEIPELTLIQCPKFRALEVRFIRIHRLHIWMNNNEMLLTSNTRNDIWLLDISGWEELHCLPKGMRNLGRIHHLTITGCCRLTSLSDGSDDLEYVESLSISNCPKLSSIPEGLKKRLESQLHVEGCPKLQL